MLTPDLEKIPPELKDRPQWVNWKPDKTPVNPKTGGNAQADNPATWGKFDQAMTYCEAHKGNGIAGVGYEFSYYDPFCGVDLDKCRDPETGQLKYCAQVIIEYLNSFSEASPSATGTHTISKAKWPENAGNSKALPCGMKIEVYDRLRYFTMTGHHLEGTPTTIEARQAELMALHTVIFGKPQAPPKEPGPRPGPELELSDRELIEKAHQAADGGKFAQLWRGDTSGYPTPSQADMALALKLAFWTNKDPDRIDRLFRESGLYQDPERQKKWDRLAAKTIAKAIAKTQEGYNPHQKRQERGKGDTMNKPKLSVVDGGGKTGEARAIDRGLRLTDLGAAERFVARHGQDLRYCYPWKKWLVNDGRRWAIDDTGRVYRCAKDVALALYAEAAAAKDKDERKALAQFAMKCEAAERQRAFLTSAQSEPGIPILPEHLDPDPWLFNVLNGTLDLRTGGLRPHNQGDLITKLAPVKYDHKAACPTWWAFLEKILSGNGPLIEFLQKAVGYAMTGSTREDCLFFLYGLGANGKSTLLEILQTLLGDYSKRTSSETFLTKKGGQIPNDIAALRGARFVAAVEVASGRRLDEVLIKELTGGDTITARFLHAEFFEFKPEFKIFLAANHKPVIRGTDHAIWRRVHLIPFNVQIPEKEQDKELPAKLKAELPGILNWAIEGCLQWLYEERLNPPQEVQAATRDYREEMDVLGDFLAECCIVAPGVSVKAKDLYASYTKWAEDNGEKKPLTQTAFGLALTERGLERKRGGGGAWVRYGIGLKADS